MNNIEFSCEKPHYEDFGYDSKACCKRYERIRVYRSIRLWTASTSRR